jgi:hypothetical protein
VKTGSAERSGLEFLVLGRAASPAMSDPVVCYTGGNKTSYCATTQAIVECGKLPWVFLPKTQDLCGQHQH